MGDHGRSAALPRRSATALGGALALAATLSAVAGGATAQPDTLAKTTEQQRIAAGAGDGFRQLGLGPGEGRTVREEGIGSAQAGRASRRRSLVYFGQLSDFQLADEESPARVEFIDTGPFSAAWRPSEATNPQIDDAMIRQLDAFSAASPVAGVGGARRAMDFAIDTGDSADSQQLNETAWVRTLLEGGALDPGSGTDPAASDDPFCVASKPAIADGDAPQRYTGVQDFDDYEEGPTPQFYDPDSPAGAFAGWPRYTGLMDRAQAPFEAAGLDVPSYVAFGNHDGLVQGNAAANAGYEGVATGCLKLVSPVVTDSSLGDALATLSPQSLQNLLASDPDKVALVPPDPRRQYVSKLQYKRVFEQGGQADGHGFGFVEPAQEQASAGTAGYYAWSPVPGFRFIALDTVSEAGVIGPSADGNVDDPQYRWLAGQLEQATAAGQLVVLFSHHAIPSLTADVADEDAPPCTADDSHGHDVNPGCDADPRDSSPIHLGEDMTALLHRYPQAIAWVAGHSHVNSIQAYPAASGTGGFWSIRVAAEADWPQQGRLLEVFDNQDGTLSIFGTIVDHASPATAPGSGTDASVLDQGTLASIGRTLAYNDPQAGGRACDGEPCGEGEAKDRNVELLVADPRAGGGAAGRCTNRIVGKRARDRIVGTEAEDRISGRGGGDRISGRGGGDCLHGNRGRDRVAGGGGDDSVGGGKGADRLRGGAGRDRFRAGGGNDTVSARGGGRDVVRCGAGKHDRAKVDRKDRVRGCERVRRGHRRR